MLAQHGVKVRLGVAVKEVHPGSCSAFGQNNVMAHTIISAGGLRASSLASSLGIESGHGGRIDVQSDLGVKGFPGVYALGDCSQTSRVRAANYFRSLRQSLSRRANTALDRFPP